MCTEHTISYQWQLLKQLPLFKFSGEILKLDNLFNVTKGKSLGVVEILVQMCLIQKQCFCIQLGTYGIMYQVSWTRQLAEGETQA